MEKVRYSYNPPKGGLSRKSDDPDDFRTLIFLDENEGIFMEMMAELAIPTHTETYRLVDEIPEVYVARSEVRQGAAELLEQRRSTYELTGELDYQPVDALSTAHSVVETGFRYGEDSQEYSERYRGLVLDCQRLVGEWYRKKKPEYFEPIRHVFDQSTEEFFSHGLSIRQMTENALTPITGNAEEESRRKNERVEDATPHILRSLGKIAIGTESVRTISECTDKAIADYADDQRHNRTGNGYNGYVPEIQKVMIRDIRLDPKTQDRFEEQVGLPGIYITHEIFQMTLAREGVDVSDKDKTELHGSQIVANDNLLDFVAKLDAVASEQWCTNIFMGELVAPDAPKDYSAFKQEALERQESLQDHAETVAQFVLELAEDNFDQTKAPAHVENFVKQLLIAEAKRDLAVAEDIFDVPTAVGLKEVVQRESEGRFEEAHMLEMTVIDAAPGGGYCGAGSCGLESVNLNGKAGKELAKKLDADSTDTVVKDTERACRCGKKSIVYAYNKHKVTKYCESCGSFESKTSKAA